MSRIALGIGILVALLSGCGDASETGSQGGVLPGDPRFERDPSLDVENVSKRGERRSHNVGLNCMGCHQEHGPGKGQFTVAGTLYGPDEAPHSNGSVELRTMPSGAGDLVIALEGDAYGNFFTTEEVMFPNVELFVVVKSEDSAMSNSMPFPTSSGACNICHNEQRRVVLAPGG